MTVKKSKTPTLDLLYTIIPTDAVWQKLTADQIYQICSKSKRWATEYSSVSFLSYSDRTKVVYFEANTLENQRGPAIASYYCITVSPNGNVGHAPILH